METNLSSTRGEQIYLLISQTHDKNFIKIGCTGDLRARMKSYETYNPTFTKVISFKMESRECGRAFEDALLLKLHERRQKKTEWFEVDEKTLTAFCKISTLEEVKSFVDLNGYFTTMIEVNKARADVEEKPNRARYYLTKAAHYKYLRELIG